METGGTSGLSLPPTHSLSWEDPPRPSVTLVLCSKETEAQKKARTGLGPTALGTDMGPKAVLFGTALLV